ncbi:MAG: hypothetical protein GY858_04745 [Candidatus Omnitrophica bacterium]|nr:hypothetical protein [Candidatus Omnitrophota bacterium]
MCTLYSTCVQKYIVGSAKVGESCSFNTDCVSGGFCENGRCICYTTHVNINAFCWQST